MSKLSGAEYWEVIAEIDFLYFMLDQTVDKTAKRSAIVQMIDKATGYEEEQFEDIKSIVARIKELQAMLPEDDSHFAKHSIKQDKKG